MDKYYCSACGTQNGGFHETTLEEAKASVFFMEEMMDFTKITTCDHCGEVGTQEILIEQEEVG